MTRLTPPLKSHGGKTYMAKRIIARMPAHLHYVEPFAGGLAVLLARDPDDRSLWLDPHKGVSELVNDLDGRLMNFWKVFQDDDTFDRFRRQAEAIPLSRPEWERAKAHHDGADPVPGGGERALDVTDAVAFFVVARQSLAGRQKAFTAITRSRTRRGINGNASEWIGAVEGLPAVHARLWSVVMENRPAVEVIRREDGAGTLFYCDPPYLHATRASKDAYACEMTEPDHQELLDVLLKVKGKVMISGYPSELYDKALTGWTRHTFDLPNNAAGGSNKRRTQEVLWMNYTPDARGGAPSR
jgi:DNA adenine methylase